MILDPATLEACRRGDAAAFRRLVELHSRPVHGLCVALAGADGEDLAQETFLRVYKAIRTFDPQGPATLRAWILTIARRLCADRARHVNLGVEVAVGEGGLDHDAVDPGADPEAAAGAAGLQECLRRAVAALPEEQRAVLVLREWDDLDYEEIAAIENVPVGTVRSRLARAREALRATLANERPRARPGAHEPPNERNHRVARAR
jgi:RNA polymerase sigma-70 factor (ECF subfamily)